VSLGLRRPWRRGFGNFRAAIRCRYRGAHRKPVAALNQADMAPVARARQRPRTVRTARYSTARAVRRQVNTPPGSVYVGAKARQRQRQNGVPEIAAKARLNCLHARQAHARGGGQLEPMIVGA
jgi:hypothetical protein